MGPTHNSHHFITITAFKDPETSANRYDKTLINANNSPQQVKAKLIISPLPSMQCLWTIGGEGETENKFQHSHIVKGQFEGGRVIKM